MTDISATLPRPKIPVWRTAYDGYRLGIGATFSSGAILRFFIYGSVLSVALLGAEMYLLIWTGMNLSERTANILSLAIPLATYIALAVVQTPLGIAIQRQILLGDVPTRSYIACVTDRRGRNYFVVSLLIAGLYFLGSLIEIPVTYLIYGEPFLAAETQDDAFPFEAYSSLVLLAWVGTFAGASLMSAKCAFLFPAVACDRSGSWRQTFTETRGIVWTLFGVFLIAFLPVVLLYVLVFLVAIVTSLTPLMETFSIGDRGSDMAMEQAMLSIFLSPIFIAAYVIAGLAYMLSFVVTAAAASRTYQIRIERGMSGVAEVFA